MGGAYLLDLAGQLSGGCEDQRLGLPHLGKHTHRESMRVMSSAGVHPTGEDEEQIDAHLDVETLQHRHAKGGRLSGSRLGPEDNREEQVRHCVCVCVVREEEEGVTRPAPYCAMTSRPLMICLMALCWIAEGFSKPAAQEENGCCITAKHISNSTLQNCHILYRMSYLFIYAQSRDNQRRDLALLQIQVD